MFYTPRGKDFVNGLLITAGIILFATGLWAIPAGLAMLWGFGWLCAKTTEDGFKESAFLWLIAAPILFFTAAAILSADAYYLLLPIAVAALCGVFHRRIISFLQEHL